MRRVFEAARAHGLPVKLHADQLTDGGGAALAGEFGALSADHLEYTSEAGVRAMAAAGTVAVLLPGAYATVGAHQPPPVAAFRAHGVAMAVATDCNPGSSPMASLLMAMNLACCLFRLTPEEALAGVTRHAARALGLAAETGTLEVGLAADVAAWRVGHPREIAYWMGGPVRAAI
jgi:imidazolonepropionase